MQLARVVGTATATVKHRSMTGAKLLIVQPLMADMGSPDGDPQIAVDCCGAGTGQTVILSSDGPTVRDMLEDDTTPVRWSVIGLEDETERSK